MPVPESTPPLRSLVVNADDFGRSPSINAAVIQAHREGILTTASLMVNEPACAEAVAQAQANPRLGVGLHLTLLMGKAALSRRQIPDLVNEDGFFSDKPVTVGMRYFFQSGLREQLRTEIRAQFAKFRETGLPLDHVNGHLHMHLHPVVFGILIQESETLGIRHLRWTRDPFWLNTRLARGHWGYRISHALIYRWLSARVRDQLSWKSIRHTDRVFGLLQNARVHEDYAVRLLEQLPAGYSELYSHPSLDDFRHELEALISPRVRALVETQRIQLIRYQDL